MRDEGDDSVQAELEDSDTVDERHPQTLEASAKPPLQRFGHYIVLGVLGKGGMGVVFKGYDDELDRQVALKVLHPDSAGSHGLSLKREAQALAKLAHPNVVQVYEVGEAEGRLFVAMELVKGQTLRQWNRDPRSSRGWKQCVEVYLQAGRGLAAAHAKGLVHRDFKPGNAVIDGEGRVRVLDFGLARRADDGADDDDDDLPVVVQRARSDDPEAVSLEQSLTNPGAVKGTLAYMPLEQMLGQEATARSDQFSFCVSLYEALYHERPFEGSTPGTLLVSVMGGTVRPPPKGSTVPTALRKVLLRGLATEPEQRWPSMDELLVELQRLVAPRGWRWVVGVGLVLALMATWVVLRQSEELSAKDDELTDKQTLIEQQLVELKEVNRALTSTLGRQQGLTAALMADEPGHRVEALHLALRGLGDEPSGTEELPIENETAIFAVTRGLHAARELRGHRDSVVDIAFSPDGTRLASASRDDTVRLWSVASGQSMLKVSGHLDDVVDVGFAPGGQRIITVSDDGTANLWRADTGEDLGSLPSDDSVTSASLSSDGRYVATGSEDGAVTMWTQGLDGMLRPTPLLPAQASAVSHVLFSPARSGLLVIHLDGTARLWTEAGSWAELTGPGARIMSAAFSSDGTLAVTGDKDGRSRLWDGNTGAPLETFEGTQKLTVVRFSPAAEQLAVAFDRVVELRDVDGGETVSLEGHQALVTDLAFSPDGRRLVTVGWDKTLRVWDPRTGATLAVLEGHDALIHRVEYSPDGHTLATSAGDGTIRLWQSEPGTERALLDGGRRRIQSMALAPDGSWVATGARRGPTRLVSLGGALDVELIGPGRTTVAMASSSDGTRLVTVDEDRTPRMWDTRSGEPLGTLPTHDRLVGALAVSSDGTWVATGDVEGVARVWNVQPTTLVAELSGVHLPHKLALDSSPDGRLLVTGSPDKTIALWDLGHPERPLRTVSERGLVFTVVFSHDGARFATAGTDECVRLWWTETMARHRSLCGHLASVTAVAFSPDDRQLVTAGKDARVQLWDASSGDKIFSLGEHAAEVIAVRFVDDGQWVLSGSVDGAVTKWMVDPNMRMRFACATSAGLIGGTPPDVVQSCQSLLSTGDPKADDRGRP